MYFHLTTRAWYPLRPFARPEIALWTWARLRRLFPEALAAVLMPNHLHLLAQARSAREAQSSFSRFLASLTRVHFPASRIWEPADRPDAITSPDKLALQIRYIALNPCRARIVDDPLQWRWSTYRGLMGATAQPWVREVEVSRALRWPTGGFRARLHSFVSSDPFAKVGGTPVPKPLARLDQASLPALARACDLAFERSGAIGRRGSARTLFLHLAREAGHRDAGRLAQLIEATTDTVWNTWARPVPEGRGAVLLTLGDGRLLSPKDG